MPKKKGLGRDVTKSLEIMDDTLKILKKFSDMPLKRGLQSNKVLDDKLSKIINSSREKTSILINDIEDLTEAIKTIKTNQNSRFASQRVVQNFIKSF